MSLPCPIKQIATKLQSYKATKKLTPGVFLSTPGVGESRGFTFIEVLVGVSLIGIVTAIGVASYNNFNEKRKVKNAADQIRSNLRFAQTKSLAGEKDCSVCGGVDVCDTPLVGWSVSFSVSPAQIQIYGQCGTTTFGNKTTDVDSGVTLTLDIPVPGGDNIILFKPMGRGNNLTGEATITVSNVGGGNPNIVYVTPGGDIR